MTPALFLKGCSSLAHCTLLLIVLPWLPTAHPDPLCDPTSTVLCSSISLPCSMTRNLGFGFPHCSMNFLYLWMCPRFSSGRRKGQRVYSCVCSLHTLGTQLLSSERRLKAPPTAVYVTEASPVHSRNCLGLSWERREKKKSKSLGYHSQLLWPFSDPQARKEGLYLTRFLSTSGVYSRDLGYLSLSAGWCWREKW